MSMTSLRIGVTGDSHLGYRQYGLDERHEDFGKAWLWTCEQFVDYNVDLVIHTGDLFHTKHPDPVAMSQAIEGVRILKDYGLKIFIVPGNHEVFASRVGWLDFLADQGHLYLVETSGRSKGFIRELIDVRLFGFPFCGSAINTQLLQALPPVKDKKFTIAVAHAGVEGVLPITDYSCISQPVLNEIRNRVDLLLLGHIHKPYQIGNWCFNPGSAETVNIKELQWPERGPMILTVEDGVVVESERLTVPRRRFVSYNLFRDLEFDISQFRDAIVTVTIEGVSDKKDNWQDVKEKTERDYGALLCRIKDETTRTEHPEQVKSSPSIPPIQTIINDLFGNKAELVFDLKDKVEQDTETEVIVKWLLSRE